MHVLGHNSTIVFSVVYKSLNKNIHVKIQPLHNYNTDPQSIKGPFADNDKVSPENE